MQKGRYLYLPACIFKKILNYRVIAKKYSSCLEG